MNIYVIYLDDPSNETNILAANDGASPQTIWVELPDGPLQERQFLPLLAGRSAMPRGEYNLLLYFPSRMSDRIVIDYAERLHPDSMLWLGQHSQTIASVVLLRVHHRALFRQKFLSNHWLASRLAEAAVRDLEAGPG